MTAKELYVQLASGNISVSSALALSAITAPLSNEEFQWVQQELNGYSGKESIPDYRQLNCEVKARVQSMINGSTQDIRLTGASIKSLDSFLQTNFGLSIYKLYVGQGVESIEQQISGHDNGDIIMSFEGPPAQELKASLKSQERVYSFTTLDVYQSAPLAYLQNSLAVIKSRLLAILQKYANHFVDRSSSASNSVKSNRVVFISYCWETDEHKAWVRKLADDLRPFFTVRIDQELPYGADLTLFMEQAIATSDKVLIIATPEYKHRADNRERGVGYETSLITDDLVTDQNRIKFIPIIRKGTKEESYPRFLGSRKGADMTDDSRYDEIFEELKRNLLEY